MLDLRRRYFRVTGGLDRRGLFIWQTKGDSLKNQVFSRVQHGFQIDLVRSPMTLFRCDFSGPRVMIFDPVAFLRLGLPPAPWRGSFVGAG